MREVDAVHLDRSLLVIVDFIVDTRRHILRLVLLGAGLLLAASLLFAGVLFMLLWGLRAVWAGLTGRPVMPFVMRIEPRGAFSHVFRTRQGIRPAAATRGPVAPARRESLADVEDVAAKQPRD